MENKLVFGHKNPDTDTICSAIAYAELKNRLGENVEPIRLGSINKETQFALDYFSAKTPRLLDSVSQEVNEVILVDHNEPQQSVDDLSEVTIVEVIDHHRISNFESEGPLYFRVEPVGCTTTILTKMYKENNVEIPKNVAGLMLSAIISDTLLLKSPTCTQEDIDTANYLSEIAGVSLQEYGLNMLKAGANTEDMSESEIISLDAKEFNMGNAKVEVAQINVVDIDEIIARKEAIENVINLNLEKKNLDLFVLMVTDILNNNSTIIVLGDQKLKVEEAFNASIKNNMIELENVVSRKKQIIPPLTKAFTS